tara:strand:- start:259 stop:606 length:348 start_codon:yes stop_codon:yes gene_type:complete
MSNMKHEVVLKTERTLSKHHEYTKKEMLDILDSVEKQAEDLGYVNITFHFKSNMEPYEDCLDSPSIVAEGLIAKTRCDLAGEEKYAYKQALAIKLGLTLYEADQYIMLQEKGIIK